MKAILFICLIALLSCNDAIDTVKCLLEIPGYKYTIEKLYESIQTKNVGEIYETFKNVLENFKDSAIDCVNKVNNLKGIICKHPIKNFECLAKCGLPDDSPRYCNCYTNCRDNYCL